MRYEDTSGSISSSATPEARGDADVLPNGSNGPATGNVITGAGTTTGKAGADTPASGHVVEVRGASGSDTTADGGNMNVDGRFGTLALDDHGNYKYVADGHAPQNFRDIFQYTLANAKGERSTADLVISRGGEIKVADNAQRMVPGPDGVIQLPAGVNLNDVHVVGRDLVVDMPDGTQIVIVDGAVFVPQLVLGGVEVPPTNLAALLIDIEAPRTVGGPPQSSGGNFDVPVPPLDPGVPLGDLIPPTELVFGQPRFEEIGQFINHEPTIEIEPENQTPSVAAQDSVDERGLPSRNEGEPAGSGEIADGNGSNNSDSSEATTGTIIIDSPDSPNTVTITDGNGVPHVVVVGLVIQGDFGTLTITGAVGSNFTYSYVLTDNTSGDNTHDDFTVTVTDHDGDSATATLRIDIIDDVPTARPDTDSIPAGQYGPATGNVITDASAGDAGDGDSGADTVGADNAHISLVTGFNGSSDNSGPFVVNGQYGVLTMQSDGSYSYVRNQGTPGGVQDVFNYTLLDGDGDTSTTTLTITIGDATPQTGENPLIRFDDDALPGGNPGTPAVGDDSPDTVNAAGTLAGSGGDGPITFAVQTTGAPAGFSYVSGGAGVVLIQQNGHTVLTVTVGANGSYSVVQNAPIDHAAGGQENNQLFTINYTVTDQDNDVANGSFSINVDDDSPIVGITEQEPSLTVDETNLAVNASADFSGAFTHSFGADGPAAANSLVYSLSVSVPGADSGLIDVATGQHVLLSVNASGVVEGRTAVSGDLAFTVSVDSSGNVTLDQIRALTHPDASNPDDNVTLASNDLIKLTLTATDHDADSASRTLNIGQHLNFHDDGPSIQASQTQPDLTVDETVLATNASASFAGVFTSSFGADGAGTVAYSLGISGPGANSGLVDTLTGQPVLLFLNGGVVEGRTAVGNDLVFTVSVDASGNVSLDQIRAVVHADTTNPDDSTTLSADSLVTLTGTITDKDGDQASATANIGQNLHFEDDGPSVQASTNQPVLTVDETILGTNASASFASVFTPNFGADGPLDADHNGIADAGAVTYALAITGGNGTLSGLVDTATGQNVVLVNNGGVIEGRTAVSNELVFTVTVNAAGTVALDQIRAVVHPDATNPDDAITLSADNLITLTATVTDGDGDQSSASANIGQNLVFEDDGPHANNDTDVTSNVTDTAVGNVISGVGTNEGPGNADQPGADGFGSITNLVGFNGSTDGDPLGGFSVNGQFGTLQMDANGNYTYTRTGGAGGATDTFTYTYVDGDGDPVSATLTITLADNTPVAGTVNVGLDDDALANGNPGGIGDDPDSVNASGNLPGSGGDAPLTFGVLLTGAPAGFTYVSGGAGIVLVKQGATTVLTVTVNSTTGAYTVVQNAPIAHAAGSDENNQAFTITYTVTDQDTDVANGSINISVDDDTPTVSANAGVQLDDDALAGGNAGGIGDDANATNTSGTLAHSYGADGAGSVAYLTTGAPAGFSYVLQGNGDLWVMQGATHVLTLTVNSSTGAYTVSQVAPIVHAAGSDENNQAFTISYRVTDGDGDTVDGSISVNVDDDTPTVSANAAVQLDDDALAGGNPGGIGDDADATNTSGTLAHSYGADGAGSVAYLTTGAPAGFSYALQGNGDLWVMQGATHILTLTVNSSTGAYTVSQVAPIVHAAGSDENNQAFTISYRVTDGDGDTVDGSISVNVDDDTPTVSANAAVQLDDDALAGGNAGGIGDDANATNTSGTLAHSYGADGAGSVAYLTTGAPAGFSYVLQGNGDLWVMQGATHVLTLTVNSSTGAYTVSQVAPIVHAAGGDENNQAFTISYRVTDGDGDTVDGSISVNVDDDTPTVSANAAVQLDDDALAGGNAGGTGDVNPDTANTSGTLAHSYGADGAGSVALLGSGAPAGFTYDTSTPGTLLIKQGATTVITVTVNATTGAYTVTQNAPIAHPAGGDENDVAFTVNYRVSDSDGDTVDGSIVINVDDDTPTATIVATGANTSLDESVGVQIDSNDTTSASVIALFAGVTAPVGTDTDLPQYATNANAIVASTGSSYGADGAGTTTYALNVSSAGVDSGLNTTDGHDILLYKEGNLIVGRVSGGADDGKAAIAIAIDNTGHISTVEYLSIQHPNAANPDDSVSIANGAVTATVTLTDSDGDSTTSTPLGIGSHIQFQDSGPVMVSAQNINIQNSGDVAHTGAFSFNLGADGANIATNDVITNVTGSATVGGVAVTNWTLTPGAEDATTASYSFSFDYPIGGGATAHETGTLVFNKAAGTYTVDLADPIQGVTTILQTATGTLFQGYEFGTSTPDNSQPAISVTQIQDLAGTANDIYVQFTGVAEPSSGTGDNNLEFSNWVPGSDNPAPVNGGGDTTWNAGQLFNQVDSWVSTSNSSNGVAGDTIQGGEVLDFSLVQGANPTGILAAPSTYAQASSMFLKFDGIGSAEDMIVVLKLYDPTTNTYTTRAIMIENGDIIKGPGAGPGSYSAITLDNNDGLVIIESNDYNGAGEHWVIVGAQISGSDEGLAGSAINLNGAIGAGGGSNTTGSFQPFSTDASDGPFKISSIGFTTVQTTAQPAHLDFNVTVTDGDGDSITQAIAVDVTAAADSTSAATIPAGNTTVAAAPLNPKVASSSLVTDTHQTSQAPQQTATNSNAVLMGAFAAAGLAASHSVAAQTIHGDLSSSVSSLATAAYHTQDLAPISLNSVGGSHGIDVMPTLNVANPIGLGEAATLHSAPEQFAAHGLMGSASPAAQPVAAAFLAGTSMPAHDGGMLGAMAPVVAMPAAHQLVALGNGSVSGVQHNQVVSQVLADALHGGGGSPAIEHALASLPGHGGMGSGMALDVLASHNAAGVPFGDSSAFAGFSAAHSAISMEAMMVHVDAVQSHT